MSIYEPTHWAWLVFTVDWIIRLTLLPAVLFRRPPAKAKTWLLLIFFEPMAGLVLFLLFGRNTLPRWRRGMIAQLPQVFAQVFDRLEGHPNLSHPLLPAELEQAVRLAENLGRLPILGGNDAELLPVYQGVINRLVADIDAAEDHVHLEFYIFAADETTRPVIEALARAVRRGVRCRVLFDAMGSRPFRKDLVRALTAAGVEFRELLPYGIFRRRSARMDLRNHRKIAVIDGRAGYTGSQNLIDAHFKEGITYEELMVRVTGPVVLELQLVFATDWFLETGEILDGAGVFPEPSPTGEVAVQALPSGPGFRTENVQRLSVALIHGARERVVITTPYLIPDEPLLQAMQTAVLRGVDVRLIVSRTADQFLVSMAQQSYYGEMLDAGVKIFLYRDWFLHAKHMTVDDSVAVIGTSNMDIRSFTLNAEINLIFYDTGVTTALHQEQERYLLNCDRLERAKWSQRPRWRKFIQAIARLFSPLL